jgi:hypothetical protein
VYVLFVEKKEENRGGAETTVRSLHLLGETGAEVVLAGPQGRVHVTRHDLDSRLRLPALMDLYIHPLYVLVSKILFFIFNSPAPIHPLYHPISTLSTVGPTFTLSKYICVI